MILIQPKNLNNEVNSSTITSNFVPEISTVNSSKYLGVLLDNFLTSKPHIKMLTNKLAKAVGILNKVKRYLNMSIYLAYTVLSFILNFTMDYSLGAQHFNHIIIK